MKKLLSTVLALTTILTCFLSTCVNAKIGDVIGTALYTDIVTYIDDYLIPTYVVNDRIVVIAEDLGNYSFDVEWNGTKRTLTISDNNTEITGVPTSMESAVSGTVYRNVLETDIKVYAQGRVITSYNVNGRTMIPLEELTMYGSFKWLPNTRVLRMTSAIPAASISASVNNSSGRYYPGTNIPTYTSITGDPLLRTDYLSDGSPVYIYELIKEGDNYPAIDYEAYLVKNGWNQIDYENDDINFRITVTYKKDTACIILLYSIKLHEFWVSPFYLK